MASTELAEKGADIDALALMAFPRAHWVQTCSTNPLARVNAEIKWRTRVVGIFPTMRRSQDWSAP